MVTRGRSRILILFPYGPLRPRATGYIGADRNVGPNRAEWTNFNRRRSERGVDDSVIVDLDHSDNSPELR